MIILLSMLLISDTGCLPNKSASVIQSADDKWKRDRADKDVTQWSERANSYEELYGTLEFKITWGKIKDQVYLERLRYNKCLLGKILQDQRADNDD